MQVFAQSIQNHPQIPRDSSPESAPSGFSHQSADRHRNQHAQVREELLQNGKRALEEFVGSKRKLQAPLDPTERKSNLNDRRAIQARLNEIEERDCS
jgi:hypothetical protein